MACPVERTNFPFRSLVPGRFGRLQFHAHGAHSLPVNSGVHPSRFKRIASLTSWRPKWMSFVGRNASKVFLGRWILHVACLAFGNSQFKTCSPNHCNGAACDAFWACDVFMACLALAAAATLPSIAPIGMFGT